MSVNDILLHQEIIILRRSDKPIEETFNELGNLLEDALSIGDVPEMSTNLMGGHYIEHHLKFKLKIRSNASVNWKGGTSIFLSEYLNDYKELEIYTPIYFKVSALHNKELPAFRDINNDSKNLVKKLKINPGVENGKFKFIHKSKIEHKPLNLNYWHMELILFDYRNPTQPVQKKLNELNKEAIGYMISHLLTFNAHTKLPDGFTKFSKRAYSK